MYVNKTKGPQVNWNAFYASAVIGMNRWHSSALSLRTEYSIRANTFGLLKHDFVFIPLT